MRISVHAVGGKMPGWVEQACAEYQRRLPREWRFSWRDVPLARRGNSAGSAGEIAAGIAQEGAQLLRGLTPAESVIALDVGGQLLSTEQLAAAVRQWQMDGESVRLLIGGPDGLSPECLRGARQRWSLGRLTLPHPLVRIVLLEQLYRAWTISVGHPYHRA
jgi:23S rRNA (pseudouridine1915-N3)-methyltransferase